MKKIILLLTLLAISILPSFSYADYSFDVRLIWDEANEREDGTPLLREEIAGYEIIYGLASDAMSTSITVDRVTSTDVLGLPSGTYYFAIATTDTSGRTGAFSDPVTLDLIAPPNSPSNVRITIITTVEITVRQ